MKIIILLVLAILITTTVTFAQPSLASLAINTKSDPVRIKKVNKMVYYNNKNYKPKGRTMPPQFKGGSQALMTYITNNLEYPTLAREVGVEGTVWVKAIVKPDGSLANIEIAQSFDALLDEAAMDVVKRMPNWQPAYQVGTPVDCRIKVPVRFTLK